MNYSEAIKNKFSFLLPWIRLTRYREYVFKILFVSLLGARCAGATLGFRLVIISLANILITTLAFMFNDIEDASEDRFDAGKRKRNPVSAGQISVLCGQFVCLAIAFFVLGLYAFIGIGPLILSLVNIIILWEYSYRRIRLKARPLVDLFSHGIMLGGMQFLCAYYAFSINFWQCLPVFITVVAASMTGQFYNQLRDLAVDRQTDLKTTTSMLGYKHSYFFMRFLQVIILVVWGYIFGQNIVPFWLLVLFFV